MQIWPSHNIAWGDSRLRPAVWKNIYPEPNTGCWLWGAYINEDGYGRGYKIARGRLLMAHRITYETFVRELEQDEELDHLCKIRACCNPDHLEPVHHTVNVLRGDSFSAVNKRKTHCKRNHLFEDGSYYSTSTGGRLCKECHKIQQAIYADRVKLGLVAGRRLTQKRKAA